MRFGFLRLLQQPAAKVLLAAGLVYLLAFEYCALHYWRDPHSAFFDIRNVFEWKYSLARERQAVDFTAAYNVLSGSDLNPAKGRESPLMCAALATVKRNNADYFEAAVGSLLAGLDPSERHALHLSILFANTDPTQHSSWGQPWVERLSDAVFTYNVSASEMKHLQELESERNFYEKGV